METFSQRTVEKLKEHTLFRLALPPFQSFLAINVDKEVEKDQRVITRAAKIHQSGTQPDPSHTAALLLEARQIDQDFVRKAIAFPIDIQIQYQDIEHYRRQRIGLLLRTSYRILEQWQEIHSLRKVIKRQYSEAQFNDVIHEILRLYAMETRMLSRSIRIPHLLGLARNKVTQTVSTVMEQESETLAFSVTRTVYRR